MVTHKEFHKSVNFPDKIGMIYAPVSVNSFIIYIYVYR